jgi:hypothetical protein
MLFLKLGFQKNDGKMATIRLLYITKNAHLKSERLKYTIILN